VADDILIGQIVLQNTRNGRSVRHLSVNAAYEHEGKWVTCSNDSEWIFNIHPEYMYMLHSNHLENTGQCSNVDLTLCCGVQ